jgi:uncharacterized membrane protein YhaH (DUF805 family)
MNWASYFFSFRGRINRAKLWLFIPIVIGIYMVYFMLYWALFGASLVAMMKGEPVGLAAGGASFGAGMILTFLLFLVIIFAGAALTVKRLHDRDKSALWLLVFWLVPATMDGMVLVNQVSLMHGNPDAMPMTTPGMVALRLAALAIGVWAFVELYCLRGTAGSNRYGPDPLAVPQSTP